MTVINRKDVRAALAAQMLADATFAAFQLIDSALHDPGGKSPALLIASRGTGGNRLTTESDSLNHRFVIHLLVGTGSASGAWTNANARDALDDVRYVLDTWIDAGNFTVGGKKFVVERDGDSDVVVPTFGNEQWLDETIPIRVRTFY